MIETENATPGEAALGLSFNLWEKPWIGIVWPDGTTARLSIYETLRKAHQIRSLHDPSPLVVAGIHRLLAAILQDIYRPERLADIGTLLQTGSFDPKWLDAFGHKYLSRFDLFSDTAPFMQTSDVLMEPNGADRIPVSSTFFELPAKTNVVHFWHYYDDDQNLCSACAA